MSQWCNKQLGRALVVTRLLRIWGQISVCTAGQRLTRYKTTRAQHAMFLYTEWAFIIITLLWTIVCRSVGEFISIGIMLNCTCAHIVWQIRIACKIHVNAVSPNVWWYTSDYLNISKNLYHYNTTQMCRIHVDPIC